MRHKLGGPKTDGARLADCENGSFSKLCETSFNETCPPEIWEISFLHLMGGEIDFYRVMVWSHKMPQTDLPQNAKPDLPQHTPIRFAPKWPRKFRSQQGTWTLWCSQGSQRRGELHISLSLLSTSWNRTPVFFIKTFRNHLRQRVWQLRNWNPIFPTLDAFNCVPKTPGQWACNMAFIMITLVVMICS